MKRSPLFWPSLVLLIGIAGYTGAAVIPAIIPQAAPTANKTNATGTIFQLAASTTPGAAGAAICDDGTGKSTTTGCLGNGLYSQAASVTVANTVTETSVISATGAEGSVTLPANFFSASGVALKVRVWGIHSASGNPTIRWQVKIGGTTVLDTTAVTSGNSTNQAFDIDGVITCRTTGTTGTVFGQGKYIEVGNALFPMSNTGTQTINTTVSNVVDITITWGTAAAGNTITATNVLLEGVFGQAAGGGGGGGAVSSVNGATGAVIIPVLTAPVQANWSGFNTVGMTQTPTYTSNRWEFAVAGSGGDNWGGVSEALPSVPYSVVFRIWPLISAQSFAHGGVGWYDGTKLVVCDISDSVSTNVATAGASNWNSVSSFNGAVTLATGIPSNVGWPSGTPVWFRLGDDNTNWTCDISADGQFWVNFMTEAHNTFLTATNLIVGSDSATTGRPQKIVFDSYK